MRKLAQFNTVFLLLLTLTHAHLLHADQMTSLGQRPDWNELDKYQHTLTHEEFLQRLNTLYAPDGAWAESVVVTDSQALIRTHTGAPAYRLIFAQSEEDRRPVPRFWHRPENVLRGNSPEQPLAGWHIALDPGHLGGKFGPLEERSWRIGNGPLIQEGDLVLAVAKVLKTKLEALGARVSLVRDHPGPTTTETPETLRPKAIAWYADLHPDGPPPSKEELERLSRLLFYRVSEIHARADLVNERLRPDLVICLHLNADPFPDSERPTLLDNNHAHALINGAYSAQELRYDDIRYGMMIKLLNDSGAVEREVAAATINELAAKAILPPFSYSGPNAVAVPGQPYLWGRNLLANRLYTCPVVFLEPYVANGQSVYPRLKAETEAIASTGHPLPNGLIEEYAQAVADGLVALQAGKSPAPPR